MLSQSDRVTLQTIIEKLHAPAAEKAAETKRRPSTIAAAYLRDMVRSAFKTLGDAALSADGLHDARLREYGLQVQIWDTANGEARGELVAESAPETVRGLASVCRAIEVAAADYHGAVPVECAAAALLTRLPTLRTAIVKNGGEAMLRVRYLAGEDPAPHMVTARVGAGGLTPDDQRYVQRR